MHDRLKTNERKEVVRNKLDEERQKSSLTHK